MASRASPCAPFSPSVESELSTQLPEWPGTGARGGKATMCGKSIGGLSGHQGMCF